MVGGHYPYDETPSDRRRNLVLGCIALGLAVVAALAVVGFVWWRHSQTSGADRVVDRLADALNAHSDSRVRDLACSGSEDELSVSVIRMNVQHAAKARDTQVSGDRATGLLVLTVRQPQADPPTFNESGYVQLEKHGSWCVTSIYNAVAY